MTKVYSIDSVTDKLNYHRQQNKKIVFTSGCFDILHRGHIVYLDFCKQQGDIVIVALNSDSSVKAYKGSDRPINNQQDRAVVLASLQSVDYIVIFNEPNPAEILRKTKPDIYIKGMDWKSKKIIEKEIVRSYGGKVMYAPLVEGKSSTNVVEKIKSLNEKP